MGKIEGRMRHGDSVKRSNTRLTVIPEREKIENGIELLSEEIIDNI